MQDVKTTTKKWTQRIRKAAKQAGAMTQRSAVQAAEAVYGKAHAWRHGAQAKKLADKVLRTGEQIIESSPVPVPVVARDAFGRMQDALGQLGNSIEGIDAGVDAKAASQVSLRGDKGAKHFSGRVQAGHDQGFGASGPVGHDKHKGKGKHSHQR